jgi:hypothetical protein
MDHISRKCRATPEVRSAYLHASGWGYLFHPHANTVAPEPESSSPLAQQPATGPYPEPTQSTPRPPSQYSYPILPSTRRSSEWFLSFRFPRQNLVNFSVPFQACHMPRQPHPPSFHLLNDIWGRVQITKILTVQLLLFSCYFIPPWSKYSP